MKAIKKTINERQRTLLISKAGGSTYKLAMIAKELGVSRATTFNFLAGKVYPKVEVLEKILQGVDITLEEFFSLENKQRISQALESSPLKE